MSKASIGKCRNSLSKHPGISHSWRENWPNLSTYFKYPQEVRHLIYTTNAIEGFDRIIDGTMDKYPEGAFSNVGTIDEAAEKGEKMLKEAGEL